MIVRSGIFLIVAGLWAAAPAAAYAQDESFEKKAGDVASQPLRDVGVMSDKIPPILVKAVEAPYSRQGIRTCSQFRNAVNQLNEVLGPDVDDVADAGESPAVGRIAEAGAKSVVASIIPFRGLVREVTGAASTDRRRAEAIATGIARRSYLKGYGAAKGCKF